MDVTPAFREAVRRRRAALGLPTPASEVLRRSTPRSTFATEALTALQAISATAGHLRETNAAYPLDDWPPSLTEAERDEIDAETQHLLTACGERVDALKGLAAVGTSSAGGSSVQLAAHRQAALQLLYEELGRVAGVFDVHRGHRLKRAAQQRDQRLGAAAEAAGAFAEHGRLAPKPPSGSASGVGLGGALVGGAVTGVVVGALGGALGASLGGGRGGRGGRDGDVGVELDWSVDEVLPETGLDERSRAQLQTENEALQKEFETMVDQAKEAEGRMLEISNLSHLFASKIEQQSTEVEQLYAQAEATAENLVRGNVNIDAASKHSRDFRLVVLTILLVATVSLLFLDWYMP